MTYLIHNNNTMNTHGKYDYNKCTEKEKGQRVHDFNDLVVGRKYIYESKSLFRNQKFIRCGELIKMELHRTYIDPFAPLQEQLEQLNQILENGYNHLYFKSGMAQYTEYTGWQPCIEEFHTQYHIPLTDHYLKIFCYNMDNKIQKQIQKYHYVKAVSKLCAVVNIGKDIEQSIIEFL